jgi:citrate lyase subunit beta/citryl-CoA lyase
MTSTTPLALPRTYLFVPGDRPDRFAKAQASGAGLVILDLEDAVAMDGKDAARGRVAEALSRGDWPACIRINGSDTPWFVDDLGLLSLPGVAAVMLPKAADIDALDVVRDAARPGVPLIPIIETAQGLAAARALGSCPGVQRLAFGSVDFQVDLGIEGDGLELLFARSQLVLASRLAGIGAPVDGVTLAVNDTAQAHADAVAARRLGFGGKLCIHPAQVAPVDEAFRPDAGTLAWARGVLQTVAGATAGALSYEGKLVDKPVVDRARAVLALAPSGQKP